VKAGVRQQLLVLTIGKNFLHLADRREFKETLATTSDGDEGP